MEVEEDLGEENEQMNGEISSQTNEHQNHSDINSFNEDDRQQSHGSPIFSKHFYKMINQQSKFHQFNATYSANDSSSSVKQPANLSITTNFNRADFSPSSCVSSSSTNSSYDDKQSKFKMLKSPHDSKKSAKEEEAIDAISPAQFSSRFNGINYNNTKASQRSDVNYLASAAGPMAQTPGDASVAEMNAGDLETGRQFGQRIAELAQKFSR